MNKQFFGKHMVSKPKLNAKAKTYLKMKNKLFDSFGATSIVTNSKSREAAVESMKKPYEFNQGRPPIDRLGRKRVKRNLLRDFSSCVAGKGSVLNLEKTNKDGSILKNSNQSMNLKAIKTARN